MKFVDLYGAVDVCRGLLHHRPQEKGKPFVPFIFFMDGIQASVIFVPVSFQIGGHVKHGTVQNVLGIKKKRNHEPSDSAVAVQKWMNHLKLNVHHGCPNKRVQLSFLLNAPIIHHVVQPVFHQGFHVHRIGRNVGGLFDRAAVGTYPVLYLSEKAGGLCVAAHAFQQNSMDFLDQAKAQRPFSETAGCKCQG